MLDIGLKMLSGLAVGVIMLFFGLFLAALDDAPGKIYTIIMLAAFAVGITGGVIAGITTLVGP